MPTLECSKRQCPAEKAKEFVVRHTLAVLAAPDSCMFSATMTMLTRIPLEWKTHTHTTKSNYHQYTKFLLKFTLKLSTQS